MDKTSANLTSIPPFPTSTTLPSIVPQSVAAVPPPVNFPTQPSVLPQAPLSMASPVPTSTTYPSVSNFSPVATPPMNSASMQSQFSSASGQMHSTANVPTSVPLYSTPAYPQPFTMPTSSMSYQPPQPPVQYMFPNPIPQTMSSAGVVNPMPVGQHMPPRVGQPVSPPIGQSVPPPTSISSYFSNDSFGIQKSGPQTSAFGIADAFSSAVGSQPNAG